MTHPILLPAKSNPLLRILNQNSLPSRTPTHVPRATLAPNMQPGPPAPAATKPPRRRVRSESDRKKHAGWRRCPRCARSVSTNGRNFYHHMHKCDRVFFADVIARIDATRTKLPPPPPPQVATPAPVLSPTTPPRPARTPLTANQRAIFLQQLCFLRVYDRTVDDVFRQVELTQTRVVGPSIFDAVRRAKRQQTQAAQPVPYTPPPYSSPVSSPPPRSQFNPVPLPEALASPITPHQVRPSAPDQQQASGSGLNRPSYAPPTSQHQPQHVVYQSHPAFQQQPLHSMSASVPALKQVVQMPAVFSSGSANKQVFENPPVSAYMYAPGSTPGNYPMSHGSAPQTQPDPSNFSALTLAPVSTNLPSSTSIPASVQGPMSANEPAPSKIPYMTNFQRSVPMSSSTPTSISASMSTIAPMSGHSAPTSNVNNPVNLPQPANMAQSLSGQGNVIASGNRPVYSGPGQSNPVPGFHEVAVPISEAQQLVSSGPTTPRQVSAMSISSVINN